MWHIVLVQYQSQACISPTLHFVLYKCSVKFWQSRFNVNNLYNSLFTATVSPSSSAPPADSESISVFRLVVHLVVGMPYLLSTVLLGLICRDRKKGDLPQLGFFNFNQSNCFICNCLVINCDSKITFKISANVVTFSYTWIENILKNSIFLIVISQYVCLKLFFFLCVRHNVRKHVGMVCQHKNMFLRGWKLCGLPVTTQYSYKWFTVKLSFLCCFHTNNSFLLIEFDQIF